MRGSQVARVMAQGMALATVVAAANDPPYDSSLNFRPDNVTWNGLYHWVGSYYNGSTTIEIKPFDGVAAQEEEADVSTWCPNLKSKTIDTKYDTILGLTARSEYDAGSNSLNALLTLWDVGYNFSSVNKSEQILDMPWDWALLSSPPMYSYNGSETQDIFNLTLAKTSEAPYKLSSTFTQYGSMSMDTTFPIGFNMTSCNGTQDIDWAATMISNDYWPDTGSNITYPDPTLDIVFDDKTANLTLNAYIQAVQGCEVKSRSKRFCSADIIVIAKMAITFEGTIDSYHSDELETTSSKPTWVKTVGFSNSTQEGRNSTIGSRSDGKKNGSSGRQFPGALALVAGVFAIFFSFLYV